MHNSQVKLIIIGISAICLTLIIGTVGYMIIQDSGFVDSLYMTVITIATVGFKEVFELSATGKLFTIFIIILGTGFIAYTATQVVDYIIAGEIKKSFWRKKMDKMLSKKKNHYIICGYGRMGKYIYDRFRDQNQESVIVENNKNAVEKMELEDILFVNGDATKSDVLEKTNIEKARGLISVVDSDSKNVYITLTAKGMNPELHVIARASDEEAATKMKWAGADRVVSPYIMGGINIANSILKPNVSEFLENAMAHNDYDIDVSEFRVDSSSPVAGKKIIESKLRKAGIIIIAIKKESCVFVYNPGPEEIIEEGDNLIVLGRHDDFVRMDNIMRGENVGV